jgi:hypothetical protein
MKHSFITYLAGFVALLWMVSCEEAIETPRIQAALDKDRLSINESMSIDFSGSVADHIVVYPGDDRQDYAQRDRSNTGLVVNKKRFSYSYRVPGDYTVVCVATTAGDRAAHLQSDTCSFLVRVIDDNTTIDRLSCPQIVRDEVFAQPYANDEWLMKLPRTVIYNDREQRIALTQRLRFYISSDSTRVSVHGAPFSATTTYNLAEPVPLSVQSDFGTVRNYTLYTLNYPAFASFRLAGVAGTAVLDRFDYSTAVWEVRLPAGTDVRAAAPEFTTYLPSEKVFVGDVAQISGSSAHDFTQNIVYRIISSVPDRPEMQAVSTVMVRIIYL